MFNHNGNSKGISSTKHANKNVDKKMHAYIGRDSVRLGSEMKSRQSDPPGRQSDRADSQTVTREKQTIRQ